MNDSTQDNPLLSLGFEIPFNAIRGEHIEPAIEALLSDARARLEAFVADARPRTFETTMLALEKVTERLDRAMGVLSHLEGTATTPALREAFSAVQPAVSQLHSSIALSEGVWVALKTYAATDEAKALTGPKARLVAKTVADFKRSGADLDPAGKERLAAIDAELATLTLRFGQNVLDATNAFEILLPDTSRLAGLPEGAIRAAQQSASDKGLSGARLTLQGPSYLAVMTYCADRALREQMYRAFSTRAASPPHDNAALLRSILDLRRERATLLGFSSFADLVLDDRMAKSGKAARDFLATLRDKAAPQAARENEELVAFQRSIEGDDAPALAAWDVSYWAELLRRARFDFDDEMLRPYFAFERVLSGALSVVETLYGVRFEPDDASLAWDPAVRAIRMHESDGRASARFFVDVFPRENKRDGAWMHGLILGVPGDEGGGRHLGVLAGNFTPPLGDKPALISHREVETLFHELGHLMHHGSSTVAVRAQGGTNVAWDFVELPSQIMENFCWEREALDLFARHNETNETIAPEVLARMRAARSFRAANAMLRQISFAELDLALHMEWRHEVHGDPIPFARRILEEGSPVPLPADHAFIAGFSHLFSSPVGYAAGYYSYKWAEVLEADAFSRFKEAGIFDPEVGRAFRERVLSKGDSEDPSELFRSFMGREPTIDALLARDGLLPQAGSASQ